MVKNLDARENQLKALAAETIANVAQLHKARRAVRHNDGIKKLVSKYEENFKFKITQHALQP